MTPDEMLETIDSIGEDFNEIRTSIQDMMSRQHDLEGALKEALKYTNPDNDTGPWRDAATALVTDDPEGADA